MLELLTLHPWLVVIVLGAIVIIACTAIVFVAEYLQKTRQADIDAALKSEMLAQGLSAADIKTILEATSDPASRSAEQPVRIGAGKFQIEVGGRPRAEAS